MNVSLADTTSHAKVSNVRRKRRRVADANRKRAAVACESCRRLKEKCEGGCPCNRCKRLKRECKITRVSNSEIETASVVDGRNAEAADDSSESEGNTVNPVSQNATDYSDELSHSNFSQRLQQKVDINEHPPSSPRPATKLPSNVRKFPKLIEATAIIPPLPIANFLIDTFFEITQTNYSYVDEHYIRQKFEGYYANPTLLEAQDAAWVAILLMVLATGTQFAHLNRDKTSSQTGKSEQFAPQNAKADDAIAQTFYNHAKELIPDIITLASVESVQAFLLLGIYALPVDANGLAWIYLGLALRIAIQNGMHRKSKKKIKVREAELQKRIWWTAYTLERRISVLHGKPVSILRADVDVDLPSEMQELRAPNRTNTMPNILAMIKLIDLLEDARDKMLELRRATRKQRSAKMDQVLNLREDLESYWESLPNTTYCRDLEPRNPLFRFNLHLALTYRLIHIFIGRSFILKGVSPNSTNPASSSDLIQEPRQWTEKCDVLVKACVQHAVAIVDLCQTLHDEVGLARSSYTEYTSCCAALLVILARRITSDNAQLQDNCDRGIKLLKHMAVGLYSDTSEKLVVEALEIAIGRLNRNRKSSTRMPTGSSTESGYENFRNWATLSQQQRRLDGGAVGAGLNSTSVTNFTDRPNVSWDPFQQFQVPEVALDNTNSDLFDIAAIDGLDQWFQYGLQ